MKLQISYADAADRYPELVAQAYQKFQKSKSKFRYMKPEEMRWQIEWCEVFNNALAADPDKPADRLAVRLARIRGWLRCLPGTATSGEFASVPDEIKKLYEKALEEEEQERKRVDSLTDEQRQAEIDEDLKELSRYPGFFAIRLGSR